MKAITGNSLERGSPSEVFSYLIPPTKHVFPETCQHRFAGDPNTPGFKISAPGSMYTRCPKDLANEHCIKKQNFTEI